MSFLMDTKIRFLLIEVIFDLINYKTILYGLGLLIILCIFVAKKKRNMKIRECSIFKD